ncbi:arsenate reductase-like glutaredoxin family protein [Geomicrobium halophilum]|uniref:Arsenate reductase-like glutaredoxin family protein n=1 Tax=Geomicrobium halophilum TaxID=549000 RepID=A0A841PJF6_9BACL|nr:hypothetical protein [Geomicrobium halophilum]MBB6448910.1 arsenate reductase-like glutaredoxin family protein [Geomicrobium halophilum]
MEMQNLMNLLVERVLAKHNITKDSVNLSEEESKRLREIVRNIEKEANEFLNDQTTTVTEDENTDSNSD